MAHAIRSIYLMRHQIPLNARILLLKSLVLSHIVFGNLFTKFICNKSKTPYSTDYLGCKGVLSAQKHDKSRDLLIQTKILPAELMIAKISLIKFLYDITRPEESETFHSI